MNNLIIGFCHQSCAFWKIGLNGYQLLLLGTSKSGFAKRERKDGLLMHAPILAVFSLFFYHFLSFHSFLFYFQFLTLLPWVVPHLVFSFLGSLSLGAYYSLTMGFFPFDASAPLGSLLSVFFSLPCFSSPLFSAVVTFLLQQTDSMGFLPFTPRASPTIFGLLWASFQDYPPTHWLPLPLLSTCLLHHYSFHDKIPFCLFLLYTSTSLPSSMACIRWSQPFITSFE